MDERIYFTSIWKNQLTVLYYLVSNRRHNTRQGSQLVFESFPHFQQTARIYKGTEWLGYYIWRFRLSFRLLGMLSDDRAWGGGRDESNGIPCLDSSWDSLVLADIVCQIVKWAATRGMLLAGWRDATSCTLVVVFSEFLS